MKFRLGLVAAALALGGAACGGDEANNSNGLTNGTPNGATNGATNGTPNNAATQLGCDTTTDFCCGVGEQCNLACTGPGCDME